jgi:hypothetical protein
VLKKKPSAKTYALAAVQNEMVTRQRVDLLNKAAEETAATVQRMAAVLDRGLVGRFRWLVTGR